MEESKEREELLYREVQVLYSAASLLTNALPRMIMNAEDYELKAALIQHLEETEIQIERLEEVAGYFDISPEGQRSTGVQELILESEHAAYDPGILDISHRIAEYQIAGYGTAAEMAEELGFEFAEELLQQSLEEVIAVDEVFRALAGKSQETDFQGSTHYLSQF